MNMKKSIILILSVLFIGLIAAQSSSQPPIRNYDEITDGWRIRRMNDSAYYKKWKEVFDANYKFIDITDDESQTYVYLDYPESNDNIVTMDMGIGTVHPHWQARLHEHYTSVTGGVLKLDLLNDIDKQYDEYCCFVRYYYVELPFKPVAFWSKYKRRICYIEFPDKQVVCIFPIAHLDALFYGRNSNAALSFKAKKIVEMDFQETKELMEVLLPGYRHDTVRNEQHIYDQPYYQCYGSPRKIPRPIKHRKNLQVNCGYAFLIAYNIKDRNFEIFKTMIEQTFVTRVFFPTLHRHSDDYFGDDFPWLN